MKQCPRDILKEDVAEGDMLDGWYQEERGEKMRELLLWLTRASGACGNDPVVKEVVRHAVNMDQKLSWD